ncbi:MAG: filamentous hemagglutinin/adhesin [Caulobacteraceae bacterium]|nr:MAG: filamentous hemagglutinin/adhesin [Caulobacteraceae bacterium]
MERFVIGAAVTVAVLIAVGGYFGHGVSDGEGFRFEIGDRGGGGGPAQAKGSGVATNIAATTYAATELKIRDAVAVVKILPEDRADISIEIANPGALAMPRVRMDGGVLVVDGGLDRRIRHCNTRLGKFEVSVNGVGEVDEAEMPVITARVPRAVDLSVGGAARTDVGPSASADLAFTGCGPTTVADVAGALDLNSAGSGDVTVGATKSASVSAAGSGDTTLGAVGEKLEVSVAGSGDVTAASLTGPLEVSIAGSGDVLISGGAVADADISIAGSGSVDIASGVGRLEVAIMGSGDVTVRGPAAAVDASIMGSGDVQVVSVAGGVQKAVMGSGSVHVGPITID